MANAPDETAALKENRDQPLPIGVFALFTPDEAMPRDRGLHVKRRGGLTLAAFLVIALCWAAGQSAAFVEDIYAAHIGAGISRGLAFTSGLVPTSLAEVAIVLVLAWGLVSLAITGWHVFSRKRRFFNALACGTLRVLCLASVAAALFYAAWGINYMRAPQIERMGWHKYAAAPADRETQVRELAELCRQLVEAANDQYLLANGSEDAGRPSVPMTELAAIDTAIDTGYERVQRELGLDAGFGAPRGPAKPVALSAVMPYLNIGGFYFPWTGEANYNRLAPYCTLPHTIAHEKAHQRCIASEDEANFFGTLACMRADDPYARYSGYLFAQRQLLGELFALDPQKAHDLVKRRHPGVQRDVDDVRAYWARYSEGVAGTVGQVSTAVNDTYLKINQVQGGVRSYALSAQLLVAYARRQGGFSPR
ncbi:MAG: DUF3810 domain-containing protein [Planctomycetes bacterium]|nr:DUF3810 domain-containing protein [Planctomycetota bacterium]MCL4731667.1 DUF3810 family protein [Planctomycetota bacterium]